MGLVLELQAGKAGDVEIDRVQPAVERGPRCVAGVSVAGPGALHQGGMFGRVFGRIFGGAFGGR